MTVGVQRAPLATEQPQPRPARLDHRAVTTPYARRHATIGATLAEQSVTAVPPGYDTSADLTGLITGSIDDLGRTATLASVAARVWRRAGLDDADRIHVVALRPDDSDDGGVEMTVNRPTDLSPGGIRAALSAPGPTATSLAGREPSSLTLVDLTGTCLDSCPPLSSAGAAGGWTITIGSAPLGLNLVVDDDGQPRIAYRRRARVHAVQSPVGAPVPAAQAVHAARAVAAFVRLIEAHR